MVTKRRIFFRVISSIFFVFLQILLIFGLNISEMPELAAASNARAVHPKMPVSLFFSGDADSMIEAEPSIEPRDEWFPPPPPPEEPDEPDEPEGPDEPDDPDNPDNPDTEDPPVTEYPFTIGYYDYSHPVPESDPVGDDYFADAVFLGDSRTKGLQLFGGVDSYYYCKVALTIRGVLTIPFIDDDSSGEIVTRTAIDTIRAYPSCFKKVYIAFGLNELGWSHTAFINTYEEVVRQLQEILPDADIYFQAVIPVAARISDAGTNGVTNAGVLDYNKRLQELAEKMGCFYLNIDESFYDEKGNLPDSLSTDGIHFGTAVCHQIMDYFRTHTVRHEDYLW